MEAGYPPRNLILVGYRGSGKSAVGGALAQRLHWTFVDTDEHITATSRQTIREIFEKRGEAAFRELEANAIVDVLRRDRQVASVGGGAVMLAANRAALRNAGVCVWLAAPAEVLFDRIRQDAATADARPPLTPLAGIDEVRHLLAQRECLYAAVAHHVVQTSGRTIAEVVDAILDRLPVLQAAEEA